MTKLGKAHYGGVIALFYAPHIQQHLIELPGGEANATWYMGDARIGHANSVTDRPDPRRPYVGNAAPRYERRRMMRSDPRMALPADWAETGGALRSRGLATLASTSSQPSMIGTPFEFGNILFGGPCNQKCVFCVGQQLPAEMSPRNHRQWPLKNIGGFIDAMNATKTKRVILSGTTTDPQLYKYEGQLVDFLRDNIQNSHLSLHTNGILALQKLDVFNKYDTATLSINSFNPTTFRRIHGVSSMPDLQTIVAVSTPTLKLSCVLTPDNVSEVESYITTAAEMGIRRIALRRVLDVKRGSQRVPIPSVLQNFEITRMHCGNPVYEIDGVEVTFWTFDETTGQSLNLFADGTLSTQYLLSEANPSLELQAEE